LKRFGFGFEPDRSRLPRLSTNDHQAKAVESLAVVRRKNVEIGGIAIVGSDNFTGAADGEADQIVGPGYHYAVAVLNRKSNKGQVATVSAYGDAIGLDIHLASFTGSTHDIGGPFLTVLEGDNFEFAWFINDIVPAQTVFIPTLFLSSE